MSTKYDHGIPVTNRSDPSVAAPERDSVKENVDIVESPSACEKELSPTRHEQPPGLVAATYGRLSGKPGVCISALGPGMLNFCFISKGLS